MAESGLDLVVAIIAVAVALWVQALDSAIERLEEFDSPLESTLAGFAFIVGLVFIGAVILASLPAFLLSGDLGHPVFMILVGAVIWSVPYFRLLGKDFTNSINGIEERRNYLILFGAIFLTGAFVLLSWHLMQNL